MSAKQAKAARREIYARFGVQLRSNRRAFKAERLAPGAMGLYAFMVMDARAELPEVDGFVPEEVVLSAWGRPAEERGAQAEALCAVDLIERVAGGYVVIKHDEHNDTRAVVEKNRKAAALRMRDVRANKDRTSTEQAANISRTEGERSPDVPISYSLSSSESGSQGEMQEGAGPPAWWATVCDVVEAGTGATIARGAAWLRYEGHRRASGKRISEPDARYWLTTVDVREQQQDRQRERTQRELAEQRRNPPERPKPSREQEQREAKEFAAALRARFKKTGTEGEQ